MFAYLKGKLVECHPTHAVIETAGGVAYFVNISLNTYSRISALKELKLYIHFHVKEDAHTLFGFAEEREREMFIHLISVSGIGPATAQIMLSSMQTTEIHRAIAEENVDLICSVKGIGPKTAKRLVLELKDKLAKIATPEQLVGIMPSNSAFREEALTALVTLGFPKPTAQKALNRAIKSGAEPASVEQLVKAALKNI